MSNKIKPDFIGIGPGRSSSTWIFDCINEHPDSCLSIPKETKFFWDDGEDMTNYEAFYKHCGQNKIIGEFTPGYIYSRKAAERIKKYYGKTKIITY